METVLFYGITIFKHLTNMLMVIIQINVRMRSVKDTKCQKTTFGIALFDQFFYCLPILSVCTSVFEIFQVYS